MKLTSLELLGFKSFLNRTVVRFSEGMTAIVGPNGCGKSNIVDAITWVLGERGTKSLRVKEMGDVIFHGSTVKKQVNMAEVTMGLINDEKEFAIKRRIYRDGTNEYYINGDLVRLKDIQDFFLGTGIGLHSYAIIEQGNIEFFTQMKPLERRVVIEETSGITRFEEKKKDAFFRMEEVKSSLERVEDILGEVSKGYEKAREESARLKIYNGLKEKLKSIDIALLLDGYVKLERRLDKLQEREEVLVREAETKGIQRNDVKEKIRSKEEEMGLTDNVVRQLEVDLKAKEKDMESRLLELNYLDEERKRLNTVSQELNKNTEEMTRRIQTTATEIETLGKSVEQERVAAEKAEQESRTLGIRREELKRMREHHEKETEEVRNELFVTMTKITEIRNKVVERERIAREREERQQKRLEEEVRLQQRLEVSEEKKKALLGRLESEQKELALMAAEEREASERFEKIGGEAAALRNSIEGLKGVKRGKEEIFRQLKSYGDNRKKNGVPYKQLINMIRTSKETEPFIERFFSKETEYYVLTEEGHHQLARAAIEHKENFIFFPKKGVFALSEGEVELKLHQVESLTEAFRRIDNGEEGLFLADAFLIDSRGFIRKEQDGQSISIREFREKMKLETEIAQVDSDLKEKSARINDVLSSQKGLEKSRSILRDMKRNLESTVAGTEREALLLDVEIKTIQERLTDSEATRQELSSEEIGGGTFLEEAEEIKIKLEEEKRVIERRMVELKTGLEEVKSAYLEIDTKFHELSLSTERQKNQIRKNEEEIERKKSEAESWEREKQTLHGKINKTVRDIEGIAAKTEELEKSHVALQEDSNKAVARYEELKTTLGSMHMEKGKLQDEIHAIDQEIEKVKAKRDGVDKERLLLQERKETIREKLRHEYGIEEIEGMPVPDIKDDGEREKILEELASLGDVNFRAEKEYTELHERHEFLERQKTDLIQAMESLRKTITKIDSVSRELFLETYEKVNEAFKRFSNTLFKGGKGMLMLNQETGGVDLYVQPPGKKVVRMELLSGGEKALISLSFLLSLMDTKPSPFTLMDEIDAPLDDANLHSLLEIVKAMALRTQILLITHNRLTMEASNTIYGVTMEEDGISKTISIRL
jgi:chromosome segregation protein